MPGPSHLIVGLGNPGNDYAGTRHNIGFMALDVLAEHYGASAWKKKFKSAAATSSDPALLFLKPLTFMNLSGEAVAEAVQFHKLAAKDVIVFHDDLDLLPGQVKVKQGGGAGGHNGLKSIDAHIGKDYWRVRLGIGRPMANGVAIKGDVVTHYVLNPFTKMDRTWLTPLLEALADEFGLMLKGKMVDYMNRVTKTMSED